MDALDELVGLFDAEEAFDQSDDEDEADKLFSRYTANTTPRPNNSQSGTSTTSEKEKAKEQQKLTYRHLFGSPIKTSKPKRPSEDLAYEGRNENIDVDLLGFGIDTTYRSDKSILPMSSSSSSSLSSFRSNTLASVSGAPRKLDYKPNSISNNVLMDPNSRIRIVRNSVNVYFDEFTPVEKSLKDRNINVDFIPLGHSSIATSKNFWTTGVLIRKVGMRQSSKGNNYNIWEINDFHNLERNWTVFLFGLTATAPITEEIGVGSVIDLVNPNILNDDAPSATTAKSSKNGLKFSLYNTNQVRLIGKAQDFGYCDARKKDGSPCKVAVNTSICPVCVHHASGELRKSMRKSNPRKSGTGSRTTKSRSGGPEPFHNYDEDRRLENEWKRRKTEGVMTTNFMATTKPSGAATLGKKLTFANPAPPPPRKASTRMELQDSNASVKRPSIQKGNHPNIVFRQDNFTTLEMPKCDVAIQKQQEAKKALVIDPHKHRHLTEKDRKILEALGGVGMSEEEKPDLPRLGLNPKILDTDLPSIVAKSTTAGARNMLEYLNSKTRADEIKKKNVDLVSRNRAQVDGGPLIMTRETLSNMKAALNYVKQVGPIKKTDPNAVRGASLKPREVPEPSSSRTSSTTNKRKRSDGENDLDHSGSTANKKEAPVKPKLAGSGIDSQKPGPSTRAGGAGTSNSKNPATKKPSAVRNLDSLFKEKDTSKLLQNEEIQQLLNAKSAHAKLAEDIKEEEYFNKLERREAVENKLLSTFHIPTTAVMCKECKYIAIGQSDLCKERRHPIKLVQANKRFFKCKDCGQRTMSLDRLPKRSCTNCKSSNWIPTSVGIERAGPKLESETLAIRGDEEKFLGSASSKLFLNL